MHVDRPLRAAQYIRMSTEHQKYSAEYQATTNQAYALAAGFEIVRTYLDEGRSGLTERRAGLQELLADVLGGTADFSILLVYDVSRWGRFQNPDQSAHYEYLCTRAGIRLQYCAEPFINDGSLTATLLKSIKRVMAAEYSRELSHKTYETQAGLSQKGYWMGAAPGYGLRRQIVSYEGERLDVLEWGQRKCLHGHRIVLVHGPPEEVATVKRLFRLYLREQTPFAELAALLNREGVPATRGKPWSRSRVSAVLNNEKYAGVLVRGRKSRKLGGPQINRAEKDWLRIEGAVKPIVSRTTFDKVRRLIRRRNLGSTNDDLIQMLRALLAKKGVLTARLIEAEPGLPCLDAFRRRFGSLTEAYRLAGYEPSEKQQQLSAQFKGRCGRGRRYSDEDLLQMLRGLLAEEGRINTTLMRAKGLPDADTFTRRFGGLRKVYALLGYAPNARQEAAMEKRGGQTMTAAAAAKLRLAVIRASTGL
ncbi:recombinase family protein [Phenylobacterium sp.]|uniref:recombinase family protein n=1 Tax=Phenylobacterium sp. TaxID=1871053 RepID=UPI0035B2E859